MAACFGDPSGAIDLTVLNGTPPYTYAWNDPNGQTVQDPQDLTAGTYTVLVTDANGCTETTSVTVDQPTAILVNIDNVSNYSGPNVTCSDATDGFAEASGVGGSAPYTYEWSTGETTAMIENLGVGTYEVIITDANGCSSVNSVTLSGPPALDLSEQILDPSCYGENDGAIIVEGQGGTSPYTYALESTNYSPVNLFGGLESGVYTVNIQDANFCESSVELTVLEPDPIVLELGMDELIQLGDSIVLDPQIVSTIGLDTFIWNNSQFVDTLDPTVKPLETTMYSLTIIDANGCTATDEIQVRVNKDRLVYIPNAFSPNGDGLNEYFQVYLGQGVRQVNNFRVFNRWGEVMFDVNEPFTAQETELQVNKWNGMFRGEMLNPAVFVYLVEVEFIDGRVELYKGDVTLMR